MGSRVPSTVVQGDTGHFEVSREWCRHHYLIEDRIVVDRLGLWRLCPAHLSEEFFSELLL